MTTPFEPSRFNFNKANPAEIVASFVSTRDFAARAAAVEAAANAAMAHTLHPTAAALPTTDPVAEGSTDSHPVLANVSPIMIGHCVVPLWATAGAPQVLTSAALSAAIEAAMSARARVGFNSLGAFASVNHLHVHIMYVSELPRQRFPIEAAPLAHCIRRAGPTATEPAGIVRGGDAVEIGLLDWPVPTFSFESADPVVAAGAAAALVALLNADEQPHSVLVVPAGADAPGDGVSFEGAPQRLHRVLVAPRQPQERFDPRLSGFNAAVCEVSSTLQLTQSPCYLARNAESFGHPWIRICCLCGESAFV
jgi:hypothetical protein